MVCQGDDNARQDPKVEIRVWAETRAFLLTSGYAYMFVVVSDHNCKLTHCVGGIGMAG